MQGQCHLNLDGSHKACRKKIWLFASNHWDVFYRQYITNIGRPDLLGYNESLLISGIREKFLTLSQDATIMTLVMEKLQPF
jgi:hypothetical protein